MIGWLRLASGGIGLAAVAALLWLAQDRFDQRARAQAAKSCARAYAAGDPLDSCLPDVKAGLTAQRAAAMCDAALLADQSGPSRFAAAQSCGAGVKRLIAVADAATAARDDLVDQLAQAAATQTRAVTRAESRADRQTERDTHARQVISAAPRRADGGIACDADCLRRLAE